MVKIKKAKKTTRPAIDPNIPSIRSAFPVVVHLVQAGKTACAKADPRKLPRLESWVADHATDRWLARVSCEECKKILRETA